MADTLVCAVVHIHEPRFPVAAESSRVNGVTVILRRDIAFVGADHTHWLIMTSVTIFEFVGSRSGRSRHKLISHTYTENRLILLHCLAQVVHSLLAELRIARSV